MRPKPFRNIMLVLFFIIFVICRYIRPEDGFVFFALMAWAGLVTVQEADDVERRNEDA